ncbi:hypothetical protein [Phenylobacterium sp.]|nr:hypothetical protein [Phenylobacterium sp.]HVI32281.1 hypothetical protein [Phenylobacterium sp.]
MTTPSRLPPAVRRTLVDARSSGAPSPTPRRPLLNDPRSTR